MKHKRQKVAKKVMTFYKNNFGIEPPYNIIVDASFVRMALNEKNKVDIWSQMPNYLGANVRLFTTTCALREMESFGRLLYGCLKVMREYNVAPCPHKDHGVDPVDCLRKTVKKSHFGTQPEENHLDNNEDGAKFKKKRQYLLATQHEDLAKKVRLIPGVPILYFHGNCMQLERISDASLKLANEVTQGKRVPMHEQERLKEMFEKEGIEMQEEDGPIHHKKKLKGPNPLSVLKKRSDPLPETKRQKISERRKWRKVRKMKKMPLPGTLEDLMLREFAIESLMGDKGVIYRKKRIAKLLHEISTAKIPGNGSLV